MKILLDPGHRNNVNDFGAIGGGNRESVLALSICKKLKARLEQHNIVTYMARESENDIVSLEQRTTKANNLNVDLYLSVHINSASNVQATGIEVLYYDDLNLAKRVCDSICQVTGASNRGPKKRTDLHVLKASKMPAVLIECGFISNTAECKQLADSNYQDKLVKAIADTIVAEYKITVVPKKQNVHEIKTTKIQLNGVVKDVAAVNIEGNNFIRLRDLQCDEILVDYSNASRMPIVEVIQG